MDPLTLAMLVLGGFGTAASTGMGVYNLLTTPARNSQALRNQYNMQYNLNKQMSGYAALEAEKQYNRTRQLISDNPLLTKEGLKNAGMSTASLEKSTSNPVVSVGQPVSGGSAPSAAAAISSNQQAISGVMDSLAQMSDFGVDFLLKNKQSELLDSQKKAQDITNTTLLEKSRAEIYNLMKEGKLDEGRYKDLMWDLNFKAETKDLEIATKTEQLLNLRVQRLETQERINTEKSRQKLMEIQGNYTEAQRQQVLKIIERYDEVVDAELQKKYAETQLTKYNWDKVGQEAEYLSNLADMVDVEKMLKEANLPYADETAKLLVGQMKSRLNLLNEKFKTAVEATKQAQFTTEHQNAVFMQQQITGYVNSTANLIGSIGSIFGGSYSAAPQAQGGSIPTPPSPSYLTGNPPAPFGN